MSGTPLDHANRLARETSPYLLQHAGNPVDWYTWGEEAFAAARESNRPILLSIGYSSCHWCHVMAHESFEDPQVAALMNRWFVNVKVDREERPDVDSVYMTAVQALTGQGGWPLTVFLTPDLEPFYGGTYFPPQDGSGRPGFARVLETLHEAWENGRERILDSAGEIAGRLREAVRRQAAPGYSPAEELPREAAASFRDAFDTAWGGFGGAPKFPSPGNLEFLLAYHVRERNRGDEGALEMVLHTLDRMAAGGIYDQLGGGFARYSVDQQWQVPHFEKMLYDNAQLARVYLHAYQLTRAPRFERIARESLDYLLREMRDPEGGFYSAQDADSEGVEGKYYVWTLSEVEAALGADAPFFAAAFGVSPGGNFIDPHHPELGSRNVLSWEVSQRDLASLFGLEPAAVAARLEQARARMLAERRRRTPPGLDDKVLVSWNGLALAAFAEGARVLDDAGYRAAAEANAAFVRERMWNGGRLLHTWRAGAARVNGLLDDYALYGLGLVELFKLTGDIAHIAWARELFEVMLREFRDQVGGGFFETPADGEALLFRPKPLFDSPTPSGNGAAALLALWLSRYCALPEWEEIAREAIGIAGEALQSSPSGFGTLLQAVEFLLSPRRELVIMGDAAARRPFEREVASRFLPWLVIAPAARSGGLPLLQGREATPGPTAWLCEGNSCRLPARSVGSLAAQLDEIS